MRAAWWRRCTPCWATDESAPAGCWCSDWPWPSQNRITPTPLLWAILQIPAGFQLKFPSAAMLSPISDPSLWSIIVVSSYRGILLQVSPSSWQLPNNCKQQKHLVSWDRLLPCGRWRLVIIFKQKNLSRCPPTTNLFHKSYWRKRKQPNIQNKTKQSTRGGNPLVPWCPNGNPFTSTPSQTNSAQLFSLQNYSNSRTHPKEEEEEEVGVCASRLLNFKMMELLKKVNSFGKEKKERNPPLPLPPPQEKTQALLTYGF